LAGRKERRKERKKERRKEQCEAPLNKLLCIENIPTP
jgi:hypothetical protein